MKQLFVLLFISISVSVMAQKFTPKVAFDVFPSGYYIKANDEILKLGDYRTRMGVDFDWKIFKVYADVHTFMDWANNGKIRFSPKVAEYYTGVKVKVNKVVFKYEHLCIHPVKVDTKMDTNLYGGYDMLSISYNY